MKKTICITDKFSNGALRPLDMKTAYGKGVYALLSVVMLIHLVIVILPVLWMVLFCFKEPAEIYAKSQSFFPKSIDLGKIGRLWNQLEMHKYYLNTFIMAAGCVIADVAIGGFAGYSLSRLKPKGSGAYMMAVITLMLVPSTCALVPNYMLFKNMGLLNTYVPMWIMSAINLFHVLLLKSAFDGISYSLVEAAKIDGASDLKIFFKIILPLSMPVVVTCAIFTFNAQFGNFFWPYLIVSDPNKMVMGVALYRIKNSTLTIDSQMTATLFSILPQIVIFVLFQKYIMGGINLGGVKG